jgi:antirestriction protein ArdC
MSNAVYEKITGKIVAALESGSIPWVKPWASQRMDFRARNAITGREYSGINRIMMWMDYHSNNRTVTIAPSRNI